MMKYCRFYMFPRISTVTKHLRKGAQNLIVTEDFFDRSLALRKHAPDLYAVLSGYYRQDPAGRNRSLKKMKGAMAGICDMLATLESVDGLAIASTVAAYKLGLGEMDLARIKVLETWWS